MKLWISNVSAAASDDDVLALVHKYCGVTGSAVVREPGDGSRPVAIVDLSGCSVDQLYDFQKRLDGMYWQGATLSVQAVTNV
ncbi:hypothetical protein [Niveibacterium sp. SC-1]|uniref:hypothetical protein n=1 Tax=Niveibacterium sp. SC-1 TaxID=3135646 RepID=UPI00311FDED9